MSIPIVWPHRASSTKGKFRREWITDQLIEANWNERGVLYRDGDGTVIYAAIQRMTVGEETAWLLARWECSEGELRRGRRDRHPNLKVALEALSAEVKVSRREFGAIPEAEWPEDRDAPWVVFGLSRTRS